MQRQIDLDALAHAAVFGKCSATPSRLPGYAMRLPNGGQVVLVARVLDVGEQLAALAHEVQAPAQQIARGAHRRPGRRRPAAASRRAAASAILWESILSFFALPPWIAFMTSAWPSTKAMPSAAHRSASQYQVNMHSTATTRSSRYGATRLEERLRARRQVLVHEHLARRDRGCRRTWSSRADRSRSSARAVGCRIASVLLLRGCALCLLASSLLRVE